MFFHQLAKNGLHRNVSNGNFEYTEDVFVDI